MWPPDIVALVRATRDVVILEDNQFALATPEGVTYYDRFGKEIEPEFTHIDWDIDVAERGRLS